MAPNLPPSITVNKNLASTIRNYIRQNGGKNVSEAEMAKILERVAQADAKRDSGEVKGGSIFDGGTKYLGGTGNDFRVKQGQTIQLSEAEYNAIFAGFLEPQKPVEETPVVETPVAEPTDIPENTGVPEPQAPEVPETEVPTDDTLITEDKPQAPDNNPIKSTKDDEDVQKQIRHVFGIADNEEIPANLTAKWVDIGGSRVLMFQKDGQTMDQTQMREYARLYKAGQAANDLQNVVSSNEGSINKIDVKELLKSKMIEPEKPIETTPEASVMSDADLAEYLENDTNYQRYSLQLNKYAELIAKAEAEGGFKHVSSFDELDNVPNDIAKVNKATDEKNFDILQRARDGFSSKMHKSRKEMVYMQKSPTYKEIAYKHDFLKRDLKGYAEIMKNWNDGEKSDFLEINGVQFTNCEKTSLPDGRRVWKTDQGVFLPGPSGWPHGGERLE